MTAPAAPLVTPSLKKEVLCVVVLENSARVGAAFDQIYTQYLDPIIRHLRTPVLSTSEAGAGHSKVTPLVRLGLVFYGDYVPDAMACVSRTAFLSDYRLYRQILHHHRFAAATAPRHAVAEGLVTALELFDAHTGSFGTDHRAAAQHCILVASTPGRPDPVRCNVTPRYDGLTLPEVRAALQRERIGLSVVTWPGDPGRLADLAQMADPALPIVDASHVSDRAFAVKLAGLGPPTFDTAIPSPPKSQTRAGPVTHPDPATPGLTSPTAKRPRLEPPTTLVKPSLTVAVPLVTSPPADTLKSPVRTGETPGRKVSKAKAVNDPSRTPKAKAKSKPKATEASPRAALELSPGFTGSLPPLTSPLVASVPAPVAIGAEDSPSLVRPDLPPPSERAAFLATATASQQEQLDNMARMNQSYRTMVQALQRSSATTVAQPVVTSPSLPGGPTPSQFAQRQTGTLHGRTMPTLHPHASPSADGPVWRGELFWPAKDRKTQKSYRHHAAVVATAGSATIRASIRALLQMPDPGPTTPFSRDSFHLNQWPATLQSTTLVNLHFDLLLRYVVENQVPFVEFDPDPGNDATVTNNYTALVRSLANKPMGAFVQLGGPTDASSKPATHPGILLIFHEKLIGIISVAPRLPPGLIKDATGANPTPTLGNATEPVLNSAVLPNTFTPHLLHSHPFGPATGRPPVPGAVAAQTQAQKQLEAHVQARAAAGRPVPAANHAALIQQALLQGFRPSNPAQLAAMLQAGNRPAGVTPEMLSLLGAARPSAVNNIAAPGVQQLHRPVGPTGAHPNPQLAAVQQQRLQMLANALASQGMAATPANLAALLGASGAGNPNFAANPGQQANQQVLAQLFLQQQQRQQQQQQLQQLQGARPRPPNPF